MGRGLGRRQRSWRSRWRRGRRRDRGKQGRQFLEREVAADDERGSDGKNDDRREDRQDGTPTAAQGGSPRSAGAVAHPARVSRTGRVGDGQADELLLELAERLPRAVRRAPVPFVEERDGIAEHTDLVERPQERADGRRGLGPAQERNGRAERQPSLLGAGIGHRGSASLLPQPAGPLAQWARCRALRVPPTRSGPSAVLPGRKGRC